MILAVDDQAAVLDAIADILRLLKKEALLAENGERARALFDEQQELIELILLDLSLPDSSGEELLGYFKAAAADIPVIIMTGYAMSIMHDKPGLSAAAGFLEKPFRLEALLNIVEQHTGKESS